jgi:hypothetical protein
MVGKEGAPPAAAMLAVSVRVSPDRVEFLCLLRGARA